MVLEGRAGKCEVCDKQAKSRCSGCVQAFYCSVEHQRQDWKIHKLQCSPMKVCHDDKVGRYFVATRNIKPGEIILREKPLVIGPSQVSGPVCVGCLKEVREKSHLECERCGWPVCSRACQENFYHANYECIFTMESRGEKVSIRNFITPHPTYGALLPLRCLLMKENDKEKWNKLMELQTHNYEAGDVQVKSDIDRVVEFIPRFFKCNKWSSEEITKVNGIARINGHELPLTNPSCVAIYNRASIFEHSCRPNLSKSFSDNNEVVFWSPSAIKANEHLTISYTDVLWETSNRRHHLKLTKHFDCDCERCSDVTEYGTFLSSLRCQKCKEGMLTPNSLPKWKEDWSCNNAECKNIVSYEKVNKFIEHIGQDLSAMEKENEGNCIKFIEHYSKWLSPNHFYITDVKIALSQIIGAGVNGIQRVSDDRLKLKAKTCSELIALIEKVAPNEARILGLIKFELHSAYAEIGRRAMQVKDPNCKAMLEDSLQYCYDAIRLLSNEPSCLPEGTICKQARINASSLETLIGGMLDVGL